MPPRPIPIFKIGDAFDNRIKQLWDDGYIEVELKPSWAPTLKGWYCLFACADRPIKKPPKQLKETA